MRPFFQFHARASSFWRRNRRAVVESISPPADEAAPALVADAPPPLFARLPARAFSAGREPLGSCTGGRALQLAVRTRIHIRNHARAARKVEKRRRLARLAARRLAEAEWAELVARRVAAWEAAHA